MTSKEVYSRCRTSFTPIMLTSKSMKPVKRVQYEKKKNERKFIEIRQSQYQFNLNDGSFNNVENKETARKRWKKIHKNGWSTNQIDEEIPTQPQNKKLTASVIRVEFHNNQLKNFRKNGEGRYSLNTKFPQQNSMMDLEKVNLQKMNKKFLYFTNFKACEMLRKNIQSNNYNSKYEIKDKKQIKLDKRKDQQKWQQYLYKYYISMKKVKPFIKNISQNKNILFQNKSNQIELTKKQQQQQQQEQKRQNQNKQKNKKYRLNLKQIKQQKDIIIQQKIIKNIFLKRILNSKKDHFIFSMNQSNSKNNNNQICKNKFQLYKEFLWKVNFTNGLYVKIKDQIEYPYKFYIGDGNNSSLIKGLMYRRYWWQIVDKIDKHTNFIWTQLKVSDAFKLQIGKIYSKPKINCEQINKQKQFQYEKNEGDKLMIGKDLLLWKQCTQKQGKKNDIITPKILHKIVKLKKMKFIQNSQKLIIHNHFQCNYFLGNKKALYYSLCAYYKFVNKHIFDYIPQTFHLHNCTDDQQYDIFVSHYCRINEERRRGIKNLWIVKPGQYTNRGKGITLCSTLDEIKIRLRAKQKNSDGSYRTFIVQKYIEKPLLYHQRKFDIRHYMLITCISGSFKAYWFEQGYIRTSSTEYHLKNYKDIYIHLTNDAIQQNSTDYGKYQKGNKVSYHDFQKYLNKHHNELNFNSILLQMKNIAIDTIKATVLQLQQKRKQHNFELFGLDFMIDEQYKVYLLEVNTNPCLQTSSCSLLSHLIVDLIDNILRICVDPLLPPSYEWSNTRKYQLSDSNRFSLIFDENQYREDNKELNQVQIDTNMGFVEQQQQQYNDNSVVWQQQGHT